MVSGKKKIFIYKLMFFSYGLVTINYELIKMVRGQTVVHAPTLNTVLMVERTLQGMEGSVMTVAELKRKLPKQVNHNTLRVILEYLEESNKIAVSMKGITWIHHSHPALKRAIERGLEL